MNIPFKIIESKITTRKEFDVVTGYQPTHSIFYLKEGTFVVEIDGIEEKVSAGDCIILPNYIPFHRKVLNPIVFVYIKFAYNENSAFSFELPYGKVHFKDKNRFLSSINNLESLLERDDPISVSFCNHLLCDILFQLHFEQNPIGKTIEERMSHDAFVVSALEYINDNINKKIKIEDICKNIGTNPTTLNYKFRRELNLSVGEYIKRERLKKAKHLLLSTTYTISEIAEKCGFENVYYFSNFFKHETGLSPSTIRNWR